MDQVTTRCSVLPRVAVVGHHTLLVDAIGRCLSTGFRVHQMPLEGHACQLSARDAVLNAKVGVVVLVVSTSDPLDPAALVVELSARGRPVVVAGQTYDAALRADLLAAGAVDVCAADEGVAHLARRLASVAGRAPVPADGVGDRHADRCHRRSSQGWETRRRLGLLSAAESRILWRLMLGQTVDDIARTHVVSVATVRSQVRVVLRKLEVRSQLAAVALAWTVDWRPPAGALAA